MCKCFYLLVCLCTMYVSARGGQKRVFDPLGLELYSVVNHHVGARIMRHPFVVLFGLLSLKNC